jgi:curli biogenesis system outer membrane secretion channel CsgG
VGSERFHVYDGQWLVPGFDTRQPPLSQLRSAAAERHVDYVVLGTLTQFSAEQHKRRFGGLLPRPVFLGGLSRQQTSLHVSLSFRVVDVRTGEVVASVIGDGVGRRRVTGFGGLGVVHGLPVGVLASAATTSIARDAMVSEALRQAVHAAALSLSSTAARLTHAAQ